MPTFKGGVHPPQNKNTAVKPIVKAKLPKKAVILLQQHAGAPAEPIVAVGDSVKTGQKIGEAKGFISANVHSSITGKVESIRKQPCPLNREVLAIIIDGSGSDEWVPLEKGAGLSELSPENIKNKIKESGVVGLGGAAFPAFVKLSTPAGVSIDTVIINGSECEPYLGADYRLMMEKPEDIVAGLEIIMKAVGAKKGYIAVEDNKPLAIEKLNIAVKNKSGLEVISLNTKYPQGAEKQLIKTVLNREIQSGKLPYTVGVVVNNTGTAVAVKNTVLENIPLIERVVTVCGPGIYEGKNLLARIGTSFRDLIEECGGFNKKVSKVIMGGPMMGTAQFSLDIPVIKATSGILVLSREEGADTSERNCIRCGRCVSVCPMHLMPNMIALFARRFLLKDSFKYNPHDCIECGSCAYVCPSKIPLVQLIKFAKGKKLAEMRNVK